MWEELHHVNYSRHSNSYKKRDILDSIDRRLNSKPPKSTIGNYKVVSLTENVGRVSHIIGKVLYKLEVKPVFHSSDKIYQLLPTPKDTLEP